MSASSNAWSTTAALRFRDFDYLGHMTATSYLALVEEARVQWLAPTDPAGRPAYVVASQRLDFHREVLPGDGPVEIVIRGAAVSLRRFDVVEEIRSVGGDLHATSRASLVAWDRAERRPRRLTPAELRLLGGAVTKDASVPGPGVPEVGTPLRADTMVPRPYDDS